MRKIIYMIMSIILFIIFISLVSAPIEEKNKGDILLKHSSLTTDTYRTSDGHFKDVVYFGAINVPYNDEFIPFEDYVNISDEKGQIKISDLGGNECYIILNYTLNNSKELANPVINITRNRGNYYFTTSIGKTVDSMAYDLKCKNVKFDDTNKNLVLNDNIKIDFSQAYTTQNIKTTYDEKTNKLQFSAIEGTTADISKIDPIVSYNFNATYQSINMNAFSNLSINETLPPTNGPHPGKEVDQTADAGLDLDDGTYTAITIPASKKGYFLFQANTSILKSDITVINWSWNGKVGNAVLDVYFYLWNASSNSWFECTNMNDSTSDTWMYCFNTKTGYSFNVADMINSTNFMHFLVFGNVTTATSARILSTDFVQLNLTYYDLVINTPISYQIIINNLSTILNTSQSTYNQTVWYTWNSGIANYTLCTNSNECEATITFPRQGYYNLTVYANKSDGTVTSKNVINLFFGNNTIYSSTGTGNKDKYCGVSSGCTNEDPNVLSANGVNSYKYSIFIYFNTSDLDEKNYIINNATLKMNISYIQGTSSYKVPVHKITGVWLDSNQTIPPYSINYSSYNSGTVQYALERVDVTSIFREFANGTSINYGFMLNGTYGSGSNYLRYNSFEAAVTTNRPTLNVTHGSPNTAPIIENNLSNATSQANTTVVFSYNISDDNDYLNNISLILDGAINTTSTNVPINVSINNSFSFTVNNLAVGTHYWNIRAFDSDGVQTNSTNFTLTITSGNSCTYSGTGNWALNCSDNCSLTSDAIIPANITMSGSGVVDIRANFTFNSTNQYIFVNSGCQINRYSGSSFP